MRELSWAPSTAMAPHIMHGQYGRADRTLMGVTGSDKFTALGFQRFLFQVEIAQLPLPITITFGKARDILSVR